MSSALLSQRLKELEYAGIIEHRVGVRKDAEYHLTEAGQELRPVIEALGFWGSRWMRSRLTSEDYDPSLLMWDMRRNIDVEQLPPGQRTVIEINLHDAKPALRRWWLVVDAGEVDLCMKDPGYEVNLHLSAELRVMVEVWMGRQSIGEAMRAGKLTFKGSRTLVSSFRECLRLSPFARAAS